MKNVINNMIKKYKNTDEISDGYHTFGELYDHRVALYIRLVNETLDKYKWHKSNLHNDGSEFKGWFIVMGYLPNQVSYHLPNKMWDLVNCEERDIADKWDGHKSEDVVDSLLGL